MQIETLGAGGDMPLPMVRPGLGVNTALAAPVRTRYRPAMRVSRRTFIRRSASCAALLVATPARAWTSFTPETFGAKGDGVTDDTVAFMRLAEHVNRVGGGTIELRRTTYIVGRQVPGPPGSGWTFPGARILELKGLTKPLVILGHGAVLRGAPGLRYGTFDAEGRATHRPMPNVKQGELATPYERMISITGCSASVEIRDLELDGNLKAMQIGGPYGDTGFQIPMIGLFLRDNGAEERITNVHTHHHGQDGIEIDGSVDRRVRSTFVDVVSEYNGRQGLSIIGGRGYDFRRCKFNHTGRAGLSSAPGAGVDLEAEGSKINRDFRFEDCEFMDNSGCGMVADSGDTEGVTFTACKFVGTSNWAAWPRKPRLRFENCTFVGQIVQCFASEDRATATQFHGCRFTDDPALSPNGKVYANGGSNAVADLGAGSKNVLFDKCVFNLVGKLVLPWSWEAIYQDCRMRQTSHQQAYPKGTYLGASTIVANVDMYGTKVLGSLTVNGVPLH